MPNRVLAYGMTDNPGGIETYLINTMKELNKQDIKLDFLCDFPQIAYKEDIENNGSKVYFIPAKGKRLIKHWLEIAKVLKEHKEYQTIYFNILDAGAVFTMMIPWIMGRKIVTHSHNGETDKKKLHKYCRPLMNFVTSEYFSCSKVAASFMFGKKAEKAVLIPNAIDMEKYRYNEVVRARKRKELGIDNNTNVICHVGRLSIQKNPFGMLDIFHELVENNENSVLLSIGTGELEKEVKECAKKLEIEKNVQFLGKRDDVSELLQAADVFFLPSFYEGLPIVVLEAQAAGLTCIVSDSITREVDITGNVQFINLHEQKNKWVNALIDSSKMARHDVGEKLKDSEYNINNYNSIIQKLIDSC